MFGSPITDIAQTMTARDGTRCPAGNHDGSQQATLREPKRA
jgi:hypothetical protein